MAEGESRIRPLVAKRASNRAVWIFMACAGLGGTALFASLESRRSAITAPAIAPGADDNALVGAGGGSGSFSSAVPPIVIPPDTAANGVQVAIMPPMPQPPVPGAGAYGSRYPAPVRLSAAPSGTTFTPPAITTSPASLPTTASIASGPEVVYEASHAKPAVNAGLADEGGGNNGKSTAERVQAGRFSNPATTVPKGTVIQAVLESALDSTRAGLARAIISRDVVGFDGSKVLIGRGSRLIGEYKADLTSGQSRAMIQWQRLMRPDGVIINLDSPSADPLGRAGVKGKVNGHFFAQYGGAILQSALNVGEQVAANKLAGSTAIYALPGIYGTPTITNPSTATGNKTQPTLTVKQGTSISVFVAHDLDFTDVE
jgi:type IV secretion system protein VirB10